MKKVLPLASALLLAGGLYSQVTVGGELATDFGVTITKGSTTRTDNEDKGTKFSRGLGTQVAIRGAGHASSHASVRKHTDWRTRRTSYLGSVGNKGSLSSMSSTNKSSASTTGEGDKPGAHTVKFTFSADKDTKGKLVIFLGGGAAGGNAAAQVTDGTKVLLAWKSGERPKSTSLDVTVGKAGTSFMVVSGGACKLDGQGRAHYSSSANLRFTPDSSTGGTKCTITKGVDGCGPVLAGKVANTSFWGHTLQFDLSKAAQNTFGINVFASKADTAKFQNCPILINVVGLGVFQTSATGTARHFMRIPSNKELEFWTQDIVFVFGSSGLKISSSNTLNVKCTKQ